MTNQTYYKLTRLSKTLPPSIITDEHGLHIITLEPRCQASENVMKQAAQMCGGTEDYAQWVVIEPTTFPASSASHQVDIVEETE